jgi:hypothetical protein
MSNSPNQDYHLDLSSFIQGYEGFNNYILILFENYVLVEIGYNQGINNIFPKIVDDIFENQHGDNIYNFFEKTGNLSEIKYFIVNNFLSNPKTSIFGYIQELFNERNNLNENFVSKIKEKINSPLFDLECYVDKEYIIKKKIDPITTNNINTISKTLKAKNQELYDNCVSSYLGYTVKSKNTNWFHEELDKMIDILQNVLGLYYNGARLTGNLLRTEIFGGENSEFDQLMIFILKHIHHDDPNNVRIPIKEKEFNYLWLEINKIIYLLIKYKKST